MEILLFTVLPHCLIKEVPRSTVHDRKSLTGREAPSTAPSVWAKCCGKLTVGPRGAQTAPPVQRRRVAESAERWRPGIPLQVQSPDTAW